MSNQPVSQAELKELKEEVKALRDDVQKLVNAWNAAGGVLQVVKYLAVVGAAITATIVAIKSKFLGS